MPKPKKNPPSRSNWDSEVRLLLWLATCVSVFSFLFYFRNGDVLLYGDAVAHINIARRVFDSKTPGLLQLGTVWLPLPHLLMIPFLLSTEMWKRGVGGSIPSMAAYVMGVVGIFRLVRGSLSRGVELDGAAHIAAWTAAVVYAANPNLIYMQATAMGESLYLAFFIWAVVYFEESARGGAKSFLKCGGCLAAACLTRYDGWFLAVVTAGAVVVFNEVRGRVFKGDLLYSRATVFKFVLIAASAPALWLAYNGIIYHNPLEFANGPYSAKAIERRTQSGGNPGHPGSGNLVLSERYFLKSAEGNVANGEWLGRAWILVLVGASGIMLVHRFRRNNRGTDVSWTPALLLTPLAFYAISVAYSGVPIFIPPWWPFSHYNVRYGLQMLPAFAVAFALLIYLLVDRAAWSGRVRLACGAAIFGLVLASYASVWMAGPICLREAQINMGGRNALETQLAGWLSKLPPDSTLLMYLGDHVGALQQAGVPLKRVINEGNHRVWMQPIDQDGLWERALANPAEYADYVIAFDGDAVSQAVRERHLRPLVEFHVTGQAAAILYRAR